jgi:hypothetical protein
VEFNLRIPTKLVWHFSEFSTVFYIFLKFIAFELGGGLWKFTRTPLALLKSLHIRTWLVGEEGQGWCWPNTGEGTAGVGGKDGQRAPGSQGAPSGGLGKGRVWPEGASPRRPRRRRKGARRRGNSR